MTSVYTGSPSGLQIEYGYGGLAVDDSAWVVRTTPTPASGLLSHQNRSIWWLLGQCVVVCLKLRELRGWHPWPLARR